MGVTRQIIGSFEDIGKDIVQEIAKVPKDVAGKALESLGTGGTKPGQQASTANISDTSKEGPLAQLDEMKDKRAKQAIARAALVQFAGGKPQKKEPSVWEKIQMEAEQKKQLATQQQSQAVNSQLPQAAAKRPRGDLFGTKAKQTSAERKAVRQD